MSERTTALATSLILAVVGAWCRGRSGPWVLTVFFFLMALGPRASGNITWDDIPTDAGAMRS
ncbi:MAG: hypothetical protein R3A10_14135 [Caldilineaceae bacterium]